MRFRDQVALTLPALVLRLALALIFIWAGLSKVLVTMPVTPDQAAALDSLGAPVGVATAPAADPAPTPRLPEPDAGSAPETPAEVPTDTTDGAAPDAALPDPSAMADVPFALHHAAWTQDTPESTTDAATDEPASEVPEETTPETVAPETTDTTPAPRAGLVTAADFPHGGEVRMVEMLTLGIDTAANPPLNADGSQDDPIWPAAIGNGPWPRVLAWAVAITEIAAGVLVLLGLLTRLGALGIFGVMLGAMWLTEIGPAMQQSNTMLGFLPDYGLANMQAWNHLLFQFILGMMALALFFLGAGAVSLDRAIFRTKRDDFDAGPNYAAADPPPESKRPV